MKKQLWGLAAISLLLGATSCTEETIESINDGKNQIEFKAALGKQTVSRAAEVKIADLQDLTGENNLLKVYSYYAGEATAFEEFTLEYDNGDWTTTPDNINQPGRPLRHYSVYPTAVAAGTAKTVDESTFKFDYVIPAVDDQVDLLGASVTTTKDVVDLQYQHLLSQVNFAVMAIKNVKIEISELTVKPAKDKSTYTFGTGWGTLLQNSGTPAYVYPLNTTSLTTLAAGTSAAQTSLMEANGGLMLMPQPFSSTNDGTFSFKFSLTVDEDGDGSFTDTSDGGAEIRANDIVISVDLCNFDTKTWAPGKRYLYVIDFSSYLVGGPISFTVNVDAWVDDKASPVAETLHVSKATKLSIDEAIAKHSAANEANTELATFPIAVATTLESGAADIVIDVIEGFDYADEIKIEFKDNTTASKLKYPDTDSSWEQDVLPSGGKVVTLRRKTVNRLNVSTATAAAIETAIAKHSATNAKAASLATPVIFSCFPINVTVDLADDADIEIGTIAGFDVGDEINITFTTDPTGKFSLKNTNTDWELDIDASSKTATFKRIKLEPLNVEKATVTTIATAIDALVAEKTRAASSSITLANFPISVAEDLDASTAIEITSIIDGFDSGNTIKIEFPTNASITHFTSTVTGWTRTNDNSTVILTKN